MKILHICPTYNTDTCGIGKYTKYFVEALSKIQGLENLVYTGAGIQIGEAIYQVKPDVVHVQLEYGFFSYERLQIVSEVCKELGTKFVITYHTIGVAHHNLVDAIRISHLPKAIFELYGKFQHLPSGIPKVTPDPDYKLNKRYDFLLFGQILQHKGVKEVIYRLPKDKTLLIIGSKPVQGDTSFYEECFNESLKYDNITWISEYLSDEKVLKASTYCDNTIFPYTEYGSIGVSAALRLIANNINIRIYTSGASHVKLEYPVKNVIDHLPLDYIFRNSDHYEPLYVTGNYYKSRRDFIDENSFDEVAKQYLKLVS